MLRVNSPGGSVFGSELVRRELELTRAAGKPVVVSMGDLAASGGYWIATASDEIIADAGTVTGSIGVFALLPTVDKTLDKLGVHLDGVATTWLRSADDPRRAARPAPGRHGPVAASTTSTATSRPSVAQARKTTPEKIDAVAQGRVWTGAQALERGLVDTARRLRRRARVGGDARQARRGLPRIVYIERDPGAFARFVDDAQRRGGARRRRRRSTQGSAASACRRSRAGAGARELGWLADLVERASAVRRGRALPLRRRRSERPAGRAAAPPPTLNPRSSKRCTTCAAPASCWPAPARARRASSRTRSRACSQAGLRAEADRRDHLHQQGRRRRCASARKALVGPRAAKDLVDQHLPLARRAHAAQRRRAAGPEAAVLASSTATTCSACCSDAGGMHRQRAGAALAVGDQRVEEPGPEQRRRPRRGAQRRRRARRRARDAALRGAPGRLPGGRLRRPDRPAAEAAAARRRGARQVAATRCATCWSTSTRTPTPTQYELLKLLVGERGDVHRGRRRRPEHLRLARRDDRQPEAPAAGLPEAEGDRARAELPLDRRASCAPPTA